MQWGVQTWDGNGRPNNYGVRPVSVLGMISLSSGQTSGTYQFQVPDGYKIGFTQSLAGSSVGIGRRITKSVNSINISPATAAGPDNYSASEITLIVFMEKI